MPINNKILIYQGKSGNLEFKGDFKNETIWATQAQISNLFEVDTRTTNEHIKNIYKSHELEKISTIRKIRIVQKEGKREVQREVFAYNLEMIIAVGYRVNSKLATKFRQWATKTLKSYLTTGFVIDKRKVALNYHKFLAIIDDVKKILPESALAFKSFDALELVKLFADTWLSIDNYDKEQLGLKKISKEIVKLETSELHDAIQKFKSELFQKGEATNLFAAGRHKNSLEGIIGNVMQSFGGKYVYDSVEEKAAHLLYFIIKNHPFVDGNKRTGAYSFIWYLAKNKRLDKNKVTPNTLTALTLLVAESDPAHKHKIVKVVMKLIEK